MNENQVKGTAKEIAGKVQEAAGVLVDSPEQRAKGLAKQVEGNAQQGVGNATETLKDAVNGRK